LRLHIEHKTLQAEQETLRAFELTKQMQLKLEMMRLITFNHPHLTMTNLKHTPIQRPNSDPQSNAEIDEKNELSADTRPETNRLVQSSPVPNEQLNEDQDKFIMNELNKITRQQALEETVRSSMQDQLNRMMGMMQDFTNGMKVMQEHHSRDQQSSSILNSSPILRRKETQLTQSAQSTQFTSQSTIKVKARSPDAFDGSKSINPKLWLQSMKRYLKLTNTPANPYALAVSLKQFRPYVEGKKVTLYTDHRALIDLNKQDKLTGKQTKRIGFIHLFNYEIKYHEGRINSVADGLSRQHAGEEHQRSEDEKIKINTLECEINCFKYHNHN